MTEIEATREHPAPLDAFETAKPDEPIWTLQGGDPLAAPLLRLWARFARRRAGVARIDPDTWFSEIIEASIASSIEHDEHEVNNLLTRATETEKISWRMDAYARGEVRAAVPTEAAETHLDDLARIDLHDFRVRAADRLRNLDSELREILIELKKRNFETVADGAADTLEDMANIADDVRLIAQFIEPRRIFKKD